MGMASIANVKLNLLSYNLDGLVNAYNNTLKSALDHHAPVITKTIIKRLSPGSMME